MLGATMGILKTITDELRRVQAERETQDLLEVIRRQLDVLTFGDLAGLLTSALGKRIASVKVSALLGPPTATVAVPTKTPAAVRPATTTKAPSKTPRRSAGKKGARKAKAKTKVASKGKAPQKATKGKKASKRASPPKGKEAADKAKAPPRSSVSPAAQDAVLRTLAGSTEPLGIRGVFEGAKLSQSQATRAVRGLVASGKVRMIGPKQRAAYTLSQRTGSGAKGPAVSPSATSATSTAARSSAPVTAKTTAGREAYSSAILTALQQAGDWIAAADLRVKVGGTSEQLRLALVRLLQAQAITKTGERNNTRYKLVG